MRPTDILWYNALSSEYRKPYYKALETRLGQERRDGKMIVPIQHKIFRAFDMTPLDRVTVVMLGQDPYPSIKQAQGIAFSVPNAEKAPGTLKNILRELKSDYGVVRKSHDLTLWSLQGVLLLNTVLTTEEGQSNAHAGYGWEKFTDQVLKVLAKRGEVMVYCLMGKEAQKKKDIINANSSGPTLIIETAHPSPNSAHRGFFWSKPFTKINAFLASHNIQPIDWSLE